MKLKLSCAIWLAVHFGIDLYSGHVIFAAIDAILSLGNLAWAWDEINALMRRRG